MLERVHTSAVAALAIAVTTSLAHATSVHVVGPGGFTTIQAAVDAAAAGDVVLVKAMSDVGGFLVDGKGVDIVCDPATVGPALHSRVTVRNLPAGQRVLLSGLTLVSGSGSGGTLVDGEGLLVDDCAGAVRVDGVEFWGTPGNPAACSGSPVTAGFAAVRIVDSASVVLSDCRLQGGFGSSLLGCSFAAAGGAGGHALSAIRSNVVLTGVDALGGDGGNGSGGGQGGSALRLQDATAVVAGGTWSGGDGGFVAPGWGGGGGGHAIELLGASYAQIVAAQLAGGSAGTGSSNGPGLALTDPTLAVQLPGAFKWLDATRAVREGGTLEIELGGEPADLGFVLLSGADAHQALYLFQGVLLAASPQVIPFGSLGASGLKSTAVAIAPLAPGVDASTIVLQGFFVSSSLGLQIGSAQNVVLLDAAF